MSRLPSDNFELSLCFVELLPEHFLPQTINFNVESVLVFQGRMVTFFKNGEQFERGVRVSLILGKTFRNFDILCDYLTSKTNIPYGVRYIFTLNGEPIHELHQLQHNASYVVSGVRQFQFLPYGQQDAMRKPHISLNSLVNGINREDLKLLRPLTPQNKFNIYEKFPLKAPGHTLTFGHDGKIVTVINSKEPELSSRVLLNLRNPSTFEIVLRDLGQAVQLPNAKKMFTAKGREVSYPFLAALNYCLYCLYCLYRLSSHKRA